jgi:dynein heavy chain 2
VKCGAWGCFDEFNRLLEEQLSAISQQIQVIQYAIKEGENKIDLIGQLTEVDPNAGIFVTMNPAGKGYGGRSKLPDNLKQLFRPVAMTAADNELIAEVLLYAEGFKHASTLATQIVTLFTLSKQLLTYQLHYDWGLRALKTILIVGGQLIQQLLKDADSDVGHKKEAEILIKAIRVNTMSKLLFIDTKRFEGLLQDIFVGIHVEDVPYKELTMNIKFTISEMNLTELEKQVIKIKQFYEATKQRMGVV